MWQTELIQMLRTEIGDDDEANPTYSDSRLERLLVNSAKLLLSEYDFDNDYTVTISTLTISPDPVTLEDDAFSNLMVRKAMCSLARGLQRIAGNKAISVRDGASSIDSTGPAREARVWADTACKDFEDAALYYALSSSKHGRAIVGPHRTNNQNLGWSSTRERQNGW